jgi:flagellar biosynthesis protein
LPALATARPDRPSATALSYEFGVDPAPRVVAQGHGLVAEKIVEVARAHGVPIHHDPVIARVLQAVDVNDHVPQELYLAVAQILTFLYRSQLQSQLRAEGAKPLA